MSPHNLGRQIAPAYASITSAIEAEQVAAYSQPSEFDTNATTTLYREQPVLYAGEVYQHGVAAPEQLHFTHTYAQYPLISSATADPTPPSTAFFPNTPYPTDPYGPSAPYAASDTSNLDDILEDDGSFPPGTASSSGAASATEEEKRRRNQAASARFRQKKKAREAQMERELKELSVRKEELEQRCAKLEVENRFLKDLLTEKEGNKRERVSVSGASGGAGVTGRARGKGKARVRDLEAEFEDEEMREVDDRKDGVGTN